MTVWDILLIIVSILLIIIIILQETKEDANEAFTGRKSELFANRKRRGIEAWVGWITTSLSVVFLILAFVVAFFTHN